MFALILLIHLDQKKNVYWSVLFTIFKQDNVFIEKLNIYIYIYIYIYIFSM